MGFHRRPGPLLTSLLVGLLLFFNWMTLAQPTSLSALAHYPHLCQSTWDADGRHYPGFFCPRLSDTPEEAYCCHLQAAGGSCCTRAEFEVLVPGQSVCPSTSSHPQGPGPAPSAGSLQPAARGSDDGRPRALLPRSGQGPVHRQERKSLLVLRRAPPAGLGWNTLKAPRDSLRLRTGADQPASLPARSRLGPAPSLPPPLT